MSNASEDVPSGSKKEETELSTLFKLRKDKAVKKTQFTKRSNQLRSLLNDFDIPDFEQLKSSRKKLNEAHDEAVEVIMQLSERLQSTGEEDQALKVLDEVEAITEVLNETESLVTSFISRNKEEWISSSDSSSSLVRSWVSQQQPAELIKVGSHPKSEVAGPSRIRVNDKRTLPTASSNDIGVDLWRQLDRVSIPKFNGSKHAYPSWKAAFTACIDNAPATAEYKLLQLRQSLQGEPSRVIENFGHSEEAYEAAKRCLERKYGGDRRLISLFLDDLEKFKPIKDGQSKALEKFADLLDVAVLNLEQAGMQNELERGTLYINLQRKLPTSLLTHYRRWLVDCEKSDSVRSLREFVEREAEFHSIASETIFGLGKRGNERPSSEQRTLFGQTQQQVTSKRDGCPNCGQNHGIWKCSKLINQSVNDRWKTITRLNLCYCCLGRNHAVKDCRKLKRCTTENCPKYHNPLLHKSNDVLEKNESFEHENPGTSAEGSNEKRVGVKNNTEERSYQTLVTKTSSFQQIAMRTIPVMLRNGNRSLRINALLDDCSTKTYINADVAAELGLEGNLETLDVGVLNGGRERFETQPVTMILSSINKNFQKEVTAYTTSNVTGNLKAVNWCDKKTNWKHLQGINFPKIEKRHVDMLIGLDYLELHTSLREVRGKSGDPVARLTPLGWTCIGCCADANENLTNFTYFVAEETSMLRSINDSLRKFWETEECYDLQTPVYNREEKQALQTAEQSMKWTGNRYEINLPWKTNVCELSNNTEMALKRLSNTEKRLLKQPDLATAYSQVIDGYLAKGYIRKVEPSPDLGAATAQQWLLPHFPILRPEKSTSPVRIVFDAAAKCNGVSLNDVLNSGPKLQRDLVHVLLRFRKHSIAIVCDIAEMYLRIQIAAEDRPYVRFLWRNMNVNRPPEVYEFNRVVFGLTSSPFLAQYVTQKHAEINCKKFPRAAETILKSTYMDDSMDSVATEKDAICLYHDLTQLWSLANMHARKWSSNSKLVMQEIPDEDKASSVNLNIDAMPCVKTLGLWWTAETDVFVYKVDVDDVKSITKRCWLSKISTIFDPLGLLSPYIVRARILVQKMWIAGFDWDEIIDGDIAEDCRKWLSELNQLHLIAIPRWLGYDDKIVSTEFHVFVDASMAAYGAVCYVRHTYENGTVNVCFVFSKVKVAPLKCTTIPRLELMAAVLGLKVCKIVSSALNALMCQFQFWSDSTNVLWWIRGCSRSFRPFVAHRVGEIQSHPTPEQWRYISSKDNPADLLSRGIEVAALANNSLWWNGPPFLEEDKSDWPKTLIPLPAQNSSETCKSSNTTFVTQLSQLNLPESEKANDWRLEPERYSDWNKLLKIYALVYRFLENCKLPRTLRKTGPIETSELQDAENRILKMTQMRYFTAEYSALSAGEPLPRNSRLHKLCPKLDHMGILRCDGRLKYAEHLSWDSRFPILLPKDCWVTILIIKYYHEKVLHHGTNHTLAALSSRFWILRAREAIKKWQSTCAVCAKEKAKPAAQIMAPLPDMRCKMPLRAFARIAVDFAGPFTTIQGRGKRRQKRYLCLFTCAASRAVHLEMAYGLDTSSFLNAFFRMTNRRGMPEEVLSDNAGNFIAAEKELKNLWQQSDINELSNCFAKNSIKWTFIPPMAPHFGGIHESMIKSAKRAIKAILSDADVTDEELLSAFIGAEGLINSRPLTYQSTDPNDNVPLTPNHLLMGQIGGIFAPESNEETCCNPLKRWRRVQELIRHFWSRWLKEWVPALNQYSKWTVEHKNLKPGDVVLVLSPDTPRAHWPLGRILRVHPGRDGRVRVATVQTNNAVIKRPIVRLCPLNI